MTDINHTANYSHIEVLAIKQLTLFNTTEDEESLRQLAQTTLQPRPEDYALVFVPEVVKKAQAGYQQLWATSPYPQAKSGQTEILVAIGKAEELLSTSGIGEVFPGGYQQIAPYLLPDKIWLVWKYVQPGESHGITYDGLVWLGDRFAWFPKPWKIIS